MTPLEHIVRTDIKKWRDAIFTAQAQQEERPLDDLDFARLAGVAAVLDTIELALNKATNPFASMGDIKCGDFTISIADTIEGAYEAVRVKKIIDSVEASLQSPHKSEGFGFHS